MNKENEKPREDFRNVKRGREWIAKIIEGIEQKRKPEEIIKEMEKTREQR